MKRTFLATPAKKVGKFISLFARTSASPGVCCPGLRWLTPTPGVFRARLALPSLLLMSCLLTTDSALTSPVPSAPFPDPSSQHCGAYLPCPPRTTHASFSLLWTLALTLISATDLVRAAPLPGSLILVTQLSRKPSGLLKHVTNLRKIPINIDLISHKLRPVLTCPGNRAAPPHTPEQYCAPPPHPQSHCAAPLSLLPPLCTGPALAPPWPSLAGLQVRADSAPAELPRRQWP